MRLLAPAQPATLLPAILRRAIGRPAMRLLATLLLATLSTAASAQVVRGTVRDDATGAPLAGVVVTLAPAGASRDALVAGGARGWAALTNTVGEFALAAGDTGRFVVVAKRIGVRQFVSAPFALARGETRRLDVRLEEVRFDLPIVTVSAVTPCGTRQDERGRIAALWAEASAALTASELALRDRLFRATISRYQRVLEPRSLSVRRETSDVRRSVTEQAFVSFPAESLAAVGYARTLDDGTIEHFAPDAQVLLSDAFVRDHCFGLARPAGREVGITFQPVRQRRLTDIEGTIWLDGRSYELHRVSFRYTNFPLPTRDSRAGGEVQFARLASGAWYVSNWFMRVPQLQMEQAATLSRRTTMTLEPRAVVTSFTETGGRVTADEQPANTAALATLNGRVTDSTGSGGLAGARVSLMGMPHETTTTPDGSFKLDSIPRGSYTLVVRHPHYTRLGVTVGEQSLDIEEGSTSITLVRAIGTTQILRQLCGYDEVPDTLTAVRLVVPPRATRPESVAPAQRPSLHLSWGRPRAMGGGIFRTVTMGTDLEIDATGGATACALPRDARVVVQEQNEDGSMGREWDFLTPLHGFLMVELQEERRASR